MSKTLAVFGATGIQGGSVIRAVLADPHLSKTFKIRAVTRDVSKPSAQTLAQQGIEVTSADMSSGPSLAAALKGAHTVFLVTVPDMVSGATPGTETEHGKNVADAAKNAGVKHLIFSSLINVTDASGGKLPHVAHFDRKADVEKHIRTEGIPATFLQPGYYMTNFTDLGLLRKSEDGSYTLAGPTSPTKAQMPLFFAGDDMGESSPFPLFPVQHLANIACPFPRQILCGSGQKPRQSPKQNNCRCRRLLHPYPHHGRVHAGDRPQGTVRAARPRSIQGLPAAAHCSGDP
jgi:hypothetical protein